MNLNDIAYYVTDKVPSTQITLEQYITTDNLLPQKGGRMCAISLPPNKCNLTHYQKGDVLVANIRPYLQKIWYADIEGGASPDVLVFRAKEGHNSQYVYACLLQDAFFNFVMKAPIGAKMPRGEKSHILRFPIIPTDNEEEVGKMISTIDRKIALNRAMNEELEAMVRQLYDYWFLQFDFPDANGKPYRSSGGKMVYNDILKREIPQGWEVGNIGDLLNKVKNTYKIPTKEYLKEGKYPIIDQSTDTYFAGWSNTADAVVTQHPVVVFGDHSCAVKYVDMDFCRGADGTQLISSNNVPTEYLYFAILDTRISSGYARHFSFLKNSPIIIPDTKYLKLYHNKTRPFFKAITSNRMDNNNLVTLRDELLPLLMNGQVTIKE